MTAARPITIIGGGLAGLTLGIGLRQRGVPTTIHEAGHYPRHRVCGEFISGNGPAVLDRMGLRGAFEKAGAIEARTVYFIAGINRSPLRTLPPALCLSRFEMDRLLADEFRGLGGELCEGKRWTAGSHNVVGQAFEPAGFGDFRVPGFNKVLEAGKLPKPAGWKACPMQEGVVLATGRRPRPTENGWRWFGLKIHARNVDLGADLEMHISRDSYVGVSRIENGEVNVCGLFRTSCDGRAALPRRQNSKNAESDEISDVLSVSGAQGERQLCPADLLRGEPGSLIHERLEKAEFDESSFCSVAGLSLKPQRAVTNDGLCIGDAITMIPPATGNGMSMAFESAELAIQPLASYSRGVLDWAAAQREIAQACDAAFACRLRWAQVLQSLLFSPVAQNRIGLCLMRSEMFWNWMFARTR